MSDSVPSNENRAPDKEPNGQPPSHAGNDERTRLTPELLEWARQLYTEEEIVAALQEVREKGGLELHEFIQDLEQELQDGESTQR
jgi:hypothetical protein